MTVYIVDIEAVHTRYTKQWKEHLPKQMTDFGLPVEVISGGDVPQMTTPGAFLNFAGTNNYKSQQMIQISELVAAGKIKDGDYFLYTDAWNPTVIQLRYMLDLLNIKAKIGGMWHAGSYDPHDFLGRVTTGNSGAGSEWLWNAEAAMFDCYNQNFFATQFHVNLFKETFSTDDDRVFIVGWPMEYLRDTIAKFANTPKKDKIIFPHRISEEKQVDIFRELAREMPQYEWFVCQDHTLTKDEYHKHLAESKLMFSASLQETLGIGAYEAALVGCMPVVPARLSYEELWSTCDGYYPSEWSINSTAFHQNKFELMTFIEGLMNQTNLPELARAHGVIAGNKYFDGTALYSTINEAIAI